MVTINKELCIGCGLCASTYEDIFEIKKGKASVKKSFSGEFTDEDLCPMDAITKNQK